MIDFEVALRECSLSVYRGGWKLLDDNEYSSSDIRERLTRCWAEVRCYSWDFGLILAGLVPVFHITTHFFDKVEYKYRVSQIWVHVIRLPSSSCRCFCSPFWLANLGEHEPIVQMARNWWMYFWVRCCFSQLYFFISRRLVRLVPALQNQLLDFSDLGCCSAMVLEPFELFIGAHHWTVWALKPKFTRRIDCTTYLWLSGTVHTHQWVKNTCQSEVKQPRPQHEWHLVVLPLLLIC